MKSRSSKTNRISLKAIIAIGLKAITTIAFLHLINFKQARNKIFKKFNKNKNQSIQLLKPYFNKINRLLKKIVAFGVK